MSLATISAPLAALSRDRRFQGLCCALLGAVAFSGKAIVAKLMYRHGADAFSVVGLRMAMALPMFILMAWWAGRSAGMAGRSPLTRRQLWHVVGLGFTGYYLASTLDFLGLQYISASLERAILYLNPSLVLLLSVVFLGQRLRWGQVLALLISYVGVLIVFLHDWDAAHLVATSVTDMPARQAVAVGGVLVFFSALSYAIYLMGSGQLVQQIGSLRLVGLASCVACGMCLIQWWVVHALSGARLGGIEHLPWQVWSLSVLNATVCTVLPVWLVMRGVQLLGASVAAQLGMVGPLSTIWLASWVLDEPVSARLMLGTGTVLLGILVLSRITKPAGAPQAGELRRQGPGSDIQPEP
jgi:drug/metabolite transporter (DMT)-like permease